MSNNLIRETISNNIANVRYILKDKKKNCSYVTNSVRMAILEDYIDIVNLFIEERNFSYNELLELLKFSIYNDRPVIKNIIINKMETVPCKVCIVRPTCNQVCDLLKKRKE